jgi:hypothetical protein
MLNTRWKKAVGIGKGQLLAFMVGSQTWATEIVLLETAA